MHLHYEQHSLHRKRRGIVLVPGRPLRPRGRPPGPTTSPQPRMNRHLVSAVAASLLSAASVSAQTLDSLTLNALRWRTVGPANFEGRVTDIDGIPGSATFFVSAAAGGVWKTTNSGVTFRPVFDTYPCSSTGAVAISPSDTQ